MFKNIPDVCKNLLILNVLFYVATYVLNSKGIHLVSLLGAHYMNSPLFEPYQVVTHFFMHSDQSIFHLLFNMFSLVVFGAMLERVWGPKKFFILYLASAFGAYALYNAVGMFQIHDLQQQLMAAGYDLGSLNEYIVNGQYNMIEVYSSDTVPVIQSYISKVVTPMVGASGAVFGVMAAFAYLFPNTELMLLFPPIPIKAKFLIGGYFALELYYSFNMTAGDSIAHLAHVGGAVVGFFMVFYWNKKSKSFY